jgi:cation diffusion facilitator family transporter
MAKRSLKHVPSAEVAAVLASVIVSTVLLGAKFTAYFMTGSTAVFSDAVESIVNVVAAGFAAYSLFLAHQPADEEHPYGHGKVEFLSAGFEGGMIVIAALVILARTIEELVRGPKIEQLNVGILIMAVAGVINGLLGLVLVRSGKKRKSMTLEADGKHLLTDAITSVVVLAALGLVKLSGWAYVDPIAALIVAGYIAVIGARLLRQSAAGLMDEQDRADDLLLKGLLDAHLAPSGKEPRICSYHKLRHRHAGRYHWVDFHIMLPGQMSVAEGHRIASAIEYEIELALKEGNATAHIEPCVDPQCAGCKT